MKRGAEVGFGPPELGFPKAEAWAIGALALGCVCSWWGADPSLLAFHTVGGHTAHSQPTSSSYP
jgi:hypothetical protein